MITGLAITALAALALGIMCWKFVTIPLGYEDADGFKYGEPDEHAHSDNLGI